MCSSHVCVIYLLLLLLLLLLTAGGATVNKCLLFSLFITSPFDRPIFSSTTASAENHVSQADRLDCFSAAIMQSWEM